MKYLLVASLLVLSIACVLSDDKYTTKYDNVDIEQITKSDRLMKNYVDCCLDKLPCTPDGSELKSHITDALQTGCSKCSEKQKNSMKLVIKHLSGNKKDWWSELKAKYDPEGAFKAKYADFIAKEGVDA